MNNNNHRNVNFGNVQIIRVQRHRKFNRRNNFNHRERRLAIRNNQPGFFERIWNFFTCCNETARNTARNERRNDIVFEQNNHR